MSDHQRSFAVVTGGSNGIGFELARQFLANGSDVLIDAQDEAHLRDAAGRLSADGGTVTCWAGNLGREDQVDALHARSARLGARLMHCASMPALAWAAGSARRCMRN